MKTYIEERAIEVANYIISCNATVRQTAKLFGISKSTVHTDITDRVEKLDPDLAKSVRRVLEVNKAAAGELPGRALSACACGQVVWPAVSQHPMISRHNKGIPSPLAATHLNDILSGRQSRWGAVAWVSSGPGGQKSK